MSVDRVTNVRPNVLKVYKNRGSVPILIPISVSVQQLDLTTYQCWIFTGPGSVKKDNIVQWMTESGIPHWYLRSDYRSLVFNVESEEHAMFIKLKWDGVHEGT